MGAIKANNYSFEEMHFSKLGRAFAHPARRRIIQILLEKDHTRNIDLSTELKLSEPAVKKHLDQLSEAGLIHSEYQLHCYQITLNATGFEPMIRFFESFSNERKKLNIL